MPHLVMRKTDAPTKRVGGVPLIRPPQDLRGLPFSLPTFFPQCRSKDRGRRSFLFLQRDLASPRIGDRPEAPNNRKKRDIECHLIR